MRPLVFADRAVLVQTLDMLGDMLGETMALHDVQSPEAGRYEPGCVDFVDAGVLSAPLPYGEVSAAGGEAGYTYLNLAIDAALAGDVDAVATAPLNKESLQAAKLPYIDHTAVLKARAAVHEPMTLFLVKNFKNFLPHPTRLLPIHRLGDHPGTAAKDLAAMRSLLATAGNRRADRSRGRPQSPWRGTRALWP